LPQAAATVSIATAPVASSVRRLSDMFDFMTFPSLGFGSGIRSAEGA